MNRAQKIDRHSVCALSSPIERIVQRDKVMVVAPDTAAWAVFDGDEAKLFDAIVLGSSLFRVAKEQSVKEGKLLSFAENLYKAGLIQVAGKSNVRACVKQRDIHRYPRLGVLHLSDYCNLRCKYCYTCFAVSPLKAMKTETAQKIIDEMLTLPNRDVVIEFHGGEPFLRKDLMERAMSHGLAQANQMGKTITFSVQTNGTLLDDEAVRLIKAYDMHVRVSIDGPPSINDVHRVFVNGKPSSPFVGRGITALVEAGIPFDAVVVVTRRNVGDLVLIAEYLHSLGISAIRFLPIFVHGHAEKELYVPPMYFLNAYLDLIRWVIAFNKRNPKERIVLKNLIHGELQSILSFCRPYMCMSSPCGAGKDMLGFHDNGDIYACEEMNEQKDFRIGNIFDKDLKTLLDTSGVVSLLKSRDVNHIEKCAQCTWKHFCGGGCTNKSHLVHDEMFRESDYCDYYKHIFEELIWIIEDQPDAADILAYSEYKLATPRRRPS